MHASMNRVMVGDDGPPAPIYIKRLERLAYLKAPLPTH